MKENRKIDYYLWHSLKKCFEYKASTSAYKNLKEAAANCPVLKPDGSLVYRMRGQASGNVGGLEWRLCYSDSDRFYYASDLLKAGN